MGFKSGSFHRHKTGVLRQFCPAHAVASLTEISLDDLKAQGKKLILLDVDHTLVEWKQESFSPKVLDWLAKAKEMGFSLCILSNTRRVERLTRISEILGIQVLRGRFKPSTEMYHLAMDKFRVQPSEAVMIGDQIMTDIWGANRSGIDAYWVQKMQGPEFLGTKFNRVVEFILTSLMYRSMATPIDAVDEPDKKPPIWERAIFRQFFKFCMVGGISFLIDFTIRKLLMDWIHVGDNTLGYTYGKKLIEAFPQYLSGKFEPKAVFFPVACLIAGIFATFNSFVMNRKFTFKLTDDTDKGKQLVKVYAVTIIGSSINIGISSLVYHQFPSLHVIGATASGAAVAAFWNFVGQRYFAFEVHKK